MRTLNNEIKIDRANSAVENASKQEGTMRNSSKKTTWHLRWTSILRKGGLLAVFALTMLFGVQNAEAQSPDIEFYGLDATWVHELFGGRWHETESKINQIYRPGESRGGGRRGSASYRFDSPYPCYSGKYSTLKRRVQSTRWFNDGTHSDIEHYDLHCVKGQIQREDFSASPARYLNNKAMVVGRIVTEGGAYKITDYHVTRVQFTANHTSGEKNFTITIKYRVKGSRNVTTVQRSVVLKPGQKKTMGLFVPGSGKWATIDSITATENRPPDPLPSPTPPVVTPVPVPKPVTVPAPLSDNPRRPHR